MVAHTLPTLGMSVAICSRGTGTGRQGADGEEATVRVAAGGRSVPVGYIMLKKAAMKAGMWWIRSIGFIVNIHM